MNEEVKEAEEKLDLQGRRVKLSKAYLKPLDDQLFGIFRDALVGELNEKTGEWSWEKMGAPVGPVIVFRELRVGELDQRNGQLLRENLTTVDPRTDKVLKLVEVSHLTVDRD